MPPEAKPIKRSEPERPLQTKSLWEFGLFERRTHKAPRLFLRPAPPPLVLPRGSFRVVQHRLLEVLQHLVGAADVVEVPDQAVAVALVAANHAKRGPEHVRHKTRAVERGLARLAPGEPAVQKAQHLPPLKRGASFVGLFLDHPPLFPGPPQGLLSVPLRRFLDRHLSRRGSRVGLQRHRRVVAPARHRAHWAQLSKLVQPLHQAGDRGVAGWHPLHLFRAAQAPVLVGPPRKALPTSAD
mmetsp:Transcript_44383/g.75521  ORF Transcript_44383/g.75521 Transcript_44383/m.75521 type:complete len:240 (+) Transcript_44383:82-801(+)